MSSSLRFSTAVVLVLCGIASACSRAEQPAEAPQRAAKSDAAPLPTGPRLFATDEVGGVLTVIDVNTATVIATIPLGKRPRGIAVSPDGSTLYVALSGTPMGVLASMRTRCRPPTRKPTALVSSACAISVSCA